jgi:hypothetical protein
MHETARFFDAPRPVATDAEPGRVVQQTLDESPAPALCAAPTASNCGRTIGPLLIGLAGGAATGLLGLQSMAVLLRNVAQTYDKYPRVPRSWLVTSIDLPMGVLLVCFVVGLGVPLFMGLSNVLITRPRNRWEDVQAGITSGLASTLASLAAGLGWAVVLAMTVVPSINDLTVLSDSVRMPVKSAVEDHPSDKLVAAYPDLQATAPEERGGSFFAKIVADQVVGSAFAVWLGIGIALGSCGLLALCGTLAAGYLVRRGDGLRAIVLPYLELTLSCSVLLGLPFYKLLIGESAGAEGVKWLVLVAAAGLLTVLIVRAVAGRWHWMVRVMLAAVMAKDREFHHVPALWLAWVTVLVVLAVRQSWPGLMKVNLLLGWFLILPHVVGIQVPFLTYVDIVVYAAMGILLLQHFDREWRKPALAS